MHTHRSPSQAGEGKIGCLVSLVILIILGAAAYKIGPAYLNRNSLVSAAEDNAFRAGVMRKEGVVKMLRAKASDMDMPEALEPGAMVVDVQTRNTNGLNEGTCTIRLKFTQKVDLYGIYTFELETDKQISKPFMDAR
nr:hypothetical protein [uncultured Holophaga sp.]